MLFGITLVHVALSLVGIFSGFVVVFGMLAGKRLDGWTALFLATTVAPSATGFLFPFHQLLPPHKVGIISLGLLPIAILPRYGNHLTAACPSIYPAIPSIPLSLTVS